MNRFKKEEQRKHNESRSGLSEQEVNKLDREEAIEHEITILARSIHAEQFSEEYDFMFDDHVDYSNRKKGINPASDDSINKVAVERTEAGVSPLSLSGMPVSNDSWKIAYEQAEARIRDR